MSIMDTFRSPRMKQNRGKTSFMITHANYRYNVMPFGMKNTNVTCQKMKKKIFEEKFIEMIEVYMGNMIFISS